MHNIKIADEIVKAYINGESLEEFHNEQQFLFNEKKTNERQTMFVDPSNDLRSDVNNIYQELIKKISPFQFPNEERFKKFLGDTSEVEKKLVIKLVVGFPHYIKKLFKSSDDGNIYILFDLYNYASSLEEATIDDIIKDINDYLGYAISLLILDSRGSTEEEGSLAILNHAIYSASFAYYISCSEHLNYMRALNNYNVWEYIELDYLKRIKRSKRRKNKIADEYLGIIFQANHEMIIIGISGKTYLENMNEEEAYKVFQEGPTNFIDNVIESVDLNINPFLSLVYMGLNILLPLMVLAFIVWGIIITMNGTYGLIFKISPLLIAVIELAREVIRYILNRSSKLKLFIYLGCILLGIALYTIFVIL